MHDNSKVYKAIKQASEKIKELHRQQALEEALEDDEYALYRLRKGIQNG